MQGRLLIKQRFIHRLPWLFQSLTRIEKPGIIDESTSTTLPYGQCKTSYLAYFILNLVGSLFCLSSPGLANSPKPWQMYYQEPVTSVMEDIYYFHNTLLVIESAIVIVVTALILFAVIRFRASKSPIPSSTAHNTVLEVIWTLIPVLILVYIAFPSFKLLYKMDVMPKAELTIKAIGNQWYWTYEYPDHNIRFDSNMLAESQLESGQLRLLEVDNRVIVPTNTNVRLITTSSDVVHSWAVPAFGVKRDSVPGRLNETWFYVRKEGVYYGQCSELCGVKHGFMPIVVEAVSPAQFEQWLALKKNPQVPAPAAPQDNNISESFTFNKG